MKPLRVLAAGVLAGCASTDLSPEPLDPQDPPVVSVPSNPIEDELTRLSATDGDGLPDDVLAGRLARAHVAFIGEVVSEVHADVTLPKRGSVPHRFVTWRVDEPVKGAVAGETVTLRFVGGVTQGGARRLDVSGVPEFEVGDKNLLFVSEGNGRVACPLVDCESGRLYIESDHVLSSTGHLLVTLDDGRTRFAEHVVDADPVADIERDTRKIEPFGTPLLRRSLVERMHQPGPAASLLSVTPPTLR